MTYLCFMAHGPCTTNLNILVPKSEHRGCLMYKCFETGLYFYPSLFQYDLWAGWRWQSRTCARAEAAWQFITASDSCPTAGGTYETRPGSGERSVYLLYLWNNFKNICFYHNDFILIGQRDAAGSPRPHVDSRRPWWSQPAALTANQQHPCVGRRPRPRQVQGQCPPFSSYVKPVFFFMFVVCLSWCQTDHKHALL